MLINGARLVAKNIYMTCSSSCFLRTTVLKIVQWLGYMTLLMGSGFDFRQGIHDLIAMLDFALRLGPLSRLMISLMRTCLL